MKPHPLLVSILVLLPLCADGQMKSRYNLNQVRVELMDGRVVSGKWITASEDTLIMGGAKKTGGKLTPGNEINFRLKGAGRDYYGTIDGVTDTTLRVRLVDQPDTTFVIDRRYITYLEVTHVAFAPRERINIPIVKIRSIKLHIRGAGILGFLAGTLVGSVITTAMYKESLFTDTSMATATAGILVFIGSPILGVGIATSGKRHTIDGSRETFKAFVQKIAR